MKKVIAVLTVAVLFSALVLPGTALAVKGNSGKSTAPGQIKKESAEKPEVRGKSDKLGDVAVEQDGSDGEVKANKRMQVQASEEGSETAEPKKTGIANAFSRIERNLVRAQDKVLAGTKKMLPPGLVRVYEKFLGWLGLSPEDSILNDWADPGADGVDEPDGSEEDTQTPDPRDGSSEDTTTVL
jgi:hypothetical protein